MSSDRIVYTLTDEAPALATRSLLPIIRAFLERAGVAVDLKDISLAGRILAIFPECLRPEQRQEDALAELGELAKTAEANIVKLPNISASVPQLNAAIAELRAHGYELPDYPADPATDEERAIRQRYAKVLGSAVNPVLREGNSDRRVAAPVKEYARKHPHSMGAWSAASRSHVAHMEQGDFFASERSTTIPAATTVRIEHQAADGATTVLKDGLRLQEGEIIDATVMDVAALRAFLAREIDDARAEDVLWSIHLKATMMKVSDPIIFGHAVTVFFAPVFAKHAATLAEIGVDPKLGMGDLEARLENLPAERRAAIQADIQACYAERPAMAMVNSDKGITNLHVPSDVIVDASMPAAIRSSGQMWGPDGRPKDTKYVIPDRCYAGVYAATVDFCKQHGAFDPRTMGSVANVGLMAQKAEEYGSHDKTFEMTAPGTVRVVDADGAVLLEHQVAAGDIWRMCQTRDAAIRDWVKLAVARARATGAPALFWLDRDRAHDAQLIARIDRYLPEHDTAGLDLRILAPVDATRESLQRAKDGQDTISVTGNVLRDYLTDLFPILELGTSAKMLSIVPLLAGGGLYETGAGGSAPKHVQQFVEEGHLRWDSLGEFLALGVSIEDLATKSGNARAALIAEALDRTIGGILDHDRSPGRKAGQPGNASSHFYLALYWAQALAAQSADPGLAEQFAGLARQLEEQEQAIIAELLSLDGRPIDLGGYYHPDEAKVVAAMRPSATFNAALDSLGAVPR